MPRLALVCGGMLAVVVVAILALGGLRHDSLAFTLGVSPARPVAVLQPSQEACQTPLAVPPGGGFDRVRLSVGTFFAPAGPPLAVTVRDVGTSAVLARGTLPGGYPDIGKQLTHDVRVGSVGGGRRVALCIANRGTRKAAVYGDKGFVAVGSTVTQGGHALGADMALVFLKPPRPVLAAAGSIAQRAALFKPSWMGAWTAWLLGALVVLAVPALLVRAVVTA